MHLSYWAEFGLWLLKLPSESRQVMLPSLLGEPLFHWVLKTIFGSNSCSLRTEVGKKSASIFNLFSWIYNIYVNAYVWMNVWTHICMYAVQFKVQLSFYFPFIFLILLIFSYWLLGGKNDRGFWEYDHCINSV